MPEFLGLTASLMSSTIDFPIYLWKIRRGRARSIVFLPAVISPWTSYPHGRAFFCGLPLYPRHDAMGVRKAIERYTERAAGEKMGLVTRNVLESNIYRRPSSVTPRLRKTGRAPAGEAALPLFRFACPLVRDITASDHEIQTFLSRSFCPMVKSNERVAWLAHIFAKREPIHEQWHSWIVTLRAAELKQKYIFGALLK